MPVVRYFLFVGGALLALLLLSDAYAPTMPVVSAAETGVDKSVIRIRSDRKWPERVVFDTSIPTMVPAPAVTTAASVAAPAVVTAAAKAPPLQAFAQLRPAEPAKLKPQPQHKQRKIAKARMAPPMVLVAQQPRYGFFESNSW